MGLKPACNSPEQHTKKNGTTSVYSDGISELVKTSDIICGVDRHILAGKKSRHRHVEFGSESFSNAVLKQYGKGLCFQDIQRASELAHSENIDYCHFMICGGPGETMDTLEESFENSLSLPNPVILGVVGMRIYPGTPLYTRSIAEGQLSETEDLLAPHYYLAPGLTSERVFEKLNSFVARSPSWLPGDMV